MLVALAVTPQFARPPTREAGRRADESHVFEKPAKCHRRRADFRRHADRANTLALPRQRGALVFKESQDRRNFVTYLWRFRATVVINIRVHDDPSCL